MYRFLPMIILMITVYTSNAQSGSISGSVSEDLSRETLIGANLLIEEIGIGTTTDLDGNYTFPELPPGKYTIRTSYISYYSKTISDVIVKEGETTKLDIGIKAKTIEWDFSVCVISLAKIPDSLSREIEQPEKAVVTTPKDKVDGILEMSAFPNPAVNTTTLNYTLQEAGLIDIQLIDLAGRTVAILADQDYQAAGKRQLIINTSALIGGLYMVVVQTQNSSATLMLTVEK